MDRGMSRAARRSSSNISRVDSRMGMTSGFPQWPPAGPRMLWHCRWSRSAKQSFPRKAGRKTRWPTPQMGQKLLPEIKCQPLLRGQVRDVLFVIRTDEIQQVRVECDRLVEFDGPRFGVGLRVVNGDFYVHVAEVAAVETLGDPGGVRQRVAGGVEPDSVTETVALDHQRVPFPFAARVAVPGWIGSGGQRTSIGVDLAVARIEFVQHDQQSR